jgi:hypothetical protein
MIIRADGARIFLLCRCRCQYKSGTCPSGTDKPPRKATFIATLRWETVPEQVRHRLPDALRSIGRRTRLPHFKGRAVTASSRLFRSLRLLHNRQLAVLVYSPPAPQGERIITRETECQRDRQCPESAFHNIIPSELCNSRRHRHLSASEEEVCVGQKPAETPYRAADYTIRIMLRTLRQCSAEVLPSNSRVRRRQERVWRQWPVRHRPFASPASDRGIGAPYPPIPLLRCKSASAASIFD